MPAHDRLAALHDRLTAQVEALVQSQDWKDFLAVAARFHRYSAKNVLLILSQTDGEPLAEVRPELLAGHAPEGLLDSVAAQVADAGFVLRRGECGGANSRTDYLSRVVTVRDDMDDAQAVKIWPMSWPMCGLTTGSTAPNPGAWPRWRPRAWPTSCAQPACPATTTASPTWPAGPAATRRWCTRRPSGLSRRRVGLDAFGVCDAALEQAAV